MFKCFIPFKLLLRGIIWDHFKASLMELKSSLRLHTQHSLEPATPATKHCWASLVQHLGYLRFLKIHNILHCTSHKIYSVLVEKIPDKLFHRHVMQIHEMRIDICTPKICFTWSKLYLSCKPLNSISIVIKSLAFNCYCLHCYFGFFPRLCTRSVLWK